jgi:uncharacterized protein
MRDNLPIPFPQADLAAFCRKHRIRRMALFGSVLRPDFRPGSDVDVLIEFEPDARIGLFGFQAIEDELSEMLRRKVDLNTAGFLSDLFRDRVLREARDLYVAA